MHVDGFLWELCWMDVMSNIYKAHYRGNVLKAALYTATFFSSHCYISYQHRVRYYKQGSANVHCTHTCQ